MLFLTLQFQANRSQSMVVLGDGKFQFRSRGSVLRTSSEGRIVGLWKLQLGDFAIAKVVRILFEIVKHRVDGVLSVGPPAGQVWVDAHGHQWRFPATAQ